MEVELSIILEILGKPEKHIKEVMKKLVEVLGNEDGVDILNKKIHRPKKIRRENAPEDLFSIFSEIELRCKFELIFPILSKYMPSHVEVLKPNEIKMTNYDLGILMTEYTRRLHRYDEVAKRAMINNQILQNQLRRFQGAPVINRPIMLPKKIEKKVTKKRKSKKKKK